MFLLNLSGHNKRNAYTESPISAYKSYRLCRISIHHLNIRYSMVAGYPIRDDISIILGRRNIGTSPVKYVTEVKDAIIKLLKDELGLEVVSAGPKTAVGKSINFGSLCDPDPNLQEALGRDRLLTEVESSARRPVVLERFKVTKESLDCWLQRRIDAVKM